MLTVNGQNYLLFTLFVNDAQIWLNSNGHAQLNCQIKVHNIRVLYCIPTAQTES